MSPAKGETNFLALGEERSCGCCFCYRCLPSSLCFCLAVLRFPPTQASSEGHLAGPQLARGLTHQGSAAWTLSKHALMRVSGRDRRAPRTSEEQSKRTNASRAARRALSLKESVLPAPPSSSFFFSCTRTYTSRGWPSLGDPSRPLSSLGLHLVAGRGRRVRGGRNQLISAAADARTECSRSCLLALLPACRPLPGCHVARPCKACGKDARFFFFFLLCRKKAPAFTDKRAVMG